MTATIKPTGGAKHAPHRSVRFYSMESLGFTNSSSVWSETPRPAQGSHGRHIDPNPTITDWHPDEVGDQLTGSNVRWSLIVTLLVLAAGVAGFAYWLYQRPIAQAAAVEADLLEHAHDVEAALPSLERFNDENLGVAAASGALFELEREARDLFQTSGQLTGTQTDLRTASSQASSSALDGIRLASDASAYRSAVVPVLAAPELETDPELIPLDEAARQFGDWQLKFDEVRNALPEGVLPEVTRELDGVAADLTTILSQYVDALREDDAIAAAQVIAGLGDRLAGIKATMDAAIGDVQTQVADRIAETRTALTAIFEG